MNSEIVPVDYDVGTGTVILPSAPSFVEPGTVPFPSTASLTHERFGHLSEDVLRDSRSMVDNLPCSSSGGLQCPVCALSKQRRQDVVHRPAPRVRVVQPNAQVSVDLHGPYAAPGRERCTPLSLSIRTRDTPGCDAFATSRTLPIVFDNTVQRSGGPARLSLTGAPSSPGSFCRCAYSGRFAFGTRVPTPLGRTAWWSVEIRA